jgi:antitoxin (DNA-binding transcriptional repressor) of toxin-antitoxin stability system
MAASTVSAMLVHAGIPVTIYEAGKAVQLLVAIAREAGDQTLTPAAAKKFIREARPTTNRNVSTEKTRRKRT